MRKPAPNIDFGAELQAILDRFRQSRHASLQTANRETVDLYWDLGRIMQRLVEAGHKPADVVYAASAALESQFPDMLGFSTANLWSMLRHYRAYHDQPELRELAREIGWAHNVVVIGKCKTDAQRAWYLRMTARMGWTKRELAGHIDAQSHLRGEAELGETAGRERRWRHASQYARLLAGADRDAAEGRDQVAELAPIAVRFIRELPQPLAIAAIDWGASPAKDAPRIPLVLHHRAARRLVAIERIAESNMHGSYTGRMAEALAALEARETLPGEAPPIGLTLRHGRSRLLILYWTRPESPVPPGTPPPPYAAAMSPPPELADALPTPAQLGALFYSSARAMETHVANLRKAPTPVAD